MGKQGGGAIRVGKHDAEPRTPWKRYLTPFPARRKLSQAEFAVLAEVVWERRKAHRFLLAAWVFLPDHWHAIIFPRWPLTISTVMESIKVGGTRRINAGRGERGVLLQGRFFDRALGTVKEYNAKVAYIHWNPVKAGLVRRPEDWPWSSVHDYTGTLNAPSGKGTKEPQSFKKRNSALPAPYSSW